MDDDSKQLAESLIQQHGSPEAALKAAIQGAVEANEDNDSYALSVWRDVKRILRERDAA